MVGYHRIPGGDFTDKPHCHKAELDSGKVGRLAKFIKDIFE